MGKNLKGKELGIGISQRSDELYIGRYTDQYGKRQTKVFRKLAECRKWLADAKYQDEHTNINKSLDATLDTWFAYWINIKGKELKPSTIETYKSQYLAKVSPIIGNMLVSEIRPIHCQNVLNEYSDKKTKYLRKIKTIMYQVLEYAVQNDAIEKNPCNMSVNANIGEKSKQREALTIEQQRAFLDAIKDSNYNLQFRFVLQTGLRVGEMSALKWQDINLKDKTLTVKHSMSRLKGQWVLTEPKTNAGIRTIPLTEEALLILREQKEKNKNMKVINIENKDYIFLSRNGMIIHTPTYDISLKKICERNNLPQISIHILRHTFATRCIEAGMKPKTLQKILGHTTIQMTMDLYVHVTDDEKIKEMGKVAKALNLKNA